MEFFQTKIARGITAFLILPILFAYVRNSPSKSGQVAKTVSDTELACNYLMPK
jgi:hypothetical protein